MDESTKVDTLEAGSRQGSPCNNYSNKVENDYSDDDYEAFDESIQGHHHSGKRIEDEKTFR